MTLTVTQRPLNGILGGPKNVQLEIKRNDDSFSILISQFEQRIISVSSDAKYGDILHVYYNIATLCMLFDGQFFPTVEANDGVGITRSWNERTLPSFTSADFLIGMNSKLIEFDSAISNTVLEKWDIIKNELDIIHNVVLYCTSDVDMPVDMKCAFMIEAFEGFCELIEARDATFVCPSVPRGESKLRLYLLSAIDKYGTEIFSKELNTDRDKFSHMLVNSRNRIAHIRSKQGRAFLDGEESMEMTRKLFALYRVILFSLLGIPCSLYEDRLKTCVSAIDNEKTMALFLKKLKDVSVTV